MKERSNEKKRSHTKTVVSATKFSPCVMRVKKKYQHAGTRSVFLPSQESMSVSRICASSGHPRFYGLSVACARLDLPVHASSSPSTSHCARASTRMFFVSSKGDIVWALWPIGRDVFIYFFFISLRHKLGKL